MPGMKLDFLKNPHQRVATGKSLPLKQVEAIVLYGRPEQRAKVVEKLIPSSYGLSLNKTTHHILLTLLDHTDNMARVKMLYNVRTKLLDLCTSPVGNVVLQKMIEKVPSRQRKEIAQAFILNVEPDEFRRLCEHPFGNHVAQKLLEYPECADVVCPEGLVPYLSEMAVHPYGMRVVAKYIESVRGGWKRALQVLCSGTPLDDLADEDDSTDNLPDADAFLEEDVAQAIDAGVERLFASQNESMVLAALLKSLMVPAPFKDAIVAHLAEYAPDYLDPQPPKATDKKAVTKPQDDGDYAMPDFGSAPAAPNTTTTASGARTTTSGNVAAAPATTLVPRHIHAFVAALQEGDGVQREDLWKAIASDDALVDAIVASRATVAVAVAAVKFVEASRAALYKALFRHGKKTFTIGEVAEDPVRTLLLRTFIEVDADRITKAQRTELCKEAVRLAQSPTASPVLQKLLEADGTHHLAGQLYKAVEKSLADLVGHPSGSFFVQALLQFSSEEQREVLSEKLWTVLGKDMQEALSYTQGSHVMQKMLAYATDDVIKQVVEQLVGDAQAEAEEVAESGESDDDDADEGDLSADEEDAEGADEDDGEESADEEEEEAKPAKPLSRLQQIALNRKKHYGVRSNAVADYALHNRACYVIQALLRETRSRQLDQHRKMLMDELKPHVFDLSVSPWAGRVVLDAMMQSGTAQLADAMKNVVFLKAESWLSEVSDAKKQRGAGIDATTRETLKRQRELNGNGSNATRTLSGSSTGKPRARKTKH